MINIKSLRIGFEKQAGLEMSDFAANTIKLLGKGISLGAKVVAKHPLASIVAVGGGLGALAVAKHVEPAFNIVNASGNNAIARDQRALLVEQGRILQQISNSVRPSKKSDINPEQPFAVEPLA